MYNTLTVDGYQEAAEVGAASSCMSVVRVTSQWRINKHRRSLGGGVVTTGCFAAMDPDDQSGRLG